MPDEKMPFITWGSVRGGCAGPDASPVAPRWQAGSWHALGSYRIRLASPDDATALLALQHRLDARSPFMLPGAAGGAG